ncbi:MAG: class I SAM-dependent methyltransferase [Dehalococcoidales bacterium]|nr:class I SAM-dependent methyltransferase [Dehalococcoidales bacterium]
MQNTDWLEIWKEVSGATRHRSEPEKVKSGRKHFRRNSAWRPDPLLDFVLENLESHQTFLDIGAGTGRWTIPIAQKAKSVTAIEPSGSMLEMLHEKIDEAGLDNVRIVKGRWEELDVEPHDIVYCIHGMYETPDFAGFVRKMEQTARERCYLGLRLPPVDGIVNILFREIYGHPYDSANAVIAWNALYSMGIYANVVVEEGMHNWKDSSLEDAFDRAKRHLNMGSSTEYNDLIQRTLEERLTFVDGTYIWPDGMRSALLWWNTNRE